MTECDVTRIVCDDYRVVGCGVEAKWRRDGSVVGLDIEKDSVWLVWNLC